MKKTTLKLATMLLLGVTLFLGNITASAAQFIKPGLKFDDVYEVRLSSGSLISLTNADFIISETDATYIAESFLSDMINSGTTGWDSETRIIHTEKMYDADDDLLINAYSFELSQGYVVVSANLMVSNIILEWSDESRPVYDSLVTDQDEKIIYEGALLYYAETDDGNLRNLNDDIVSKSEISSVLDNITSINNVSQDVIKEIAVNKARRSASSSAETNGVNDDIITDPFTHANKYYGGPFYCSEYYNTWESYRGNATTGDFSGYNRHCGPTAITNLINMYGNRYNKSAMKSASKQAVFKWVAEYGIQNGYYNSGGTNINKAGTYIKNAFNHYGVYPSVSSKIAMNNNSIISAIRNDKLLYIGLFNHEKYRNHAVAGYAYTRLKSSSNGYYKTFIKICDGWYSTPRYLDMAVILSKSEFYSFGF